MTQDTVILEYLKTIYDIYKTISTLDTGIIVISIGLLEKIYPIPRKKGLFFLAMLSFLISLMACLREMVLTAEQIFLVLPVKNGVSVSVFMTIESFTFFILGIILLITFVFLNLKRKLPGGFLYQRQTHTRKFSRYRKRSQTR